jgi:hypothetical protein
MPGEKPAQNPIRICDDGVDINSFVVFALSATNALSPTLNVCSSKGLSVLHLVPQEVVAFGKVAAPTPRERSEPTFSLLRPDNYLVQLGCLPCR